MSPPKFIDIEGRRSLWRDIVKLRQEQCRAATEAAGMQPPLFELREDFRPLAERTAAARYLEPSLFSVLAT